jgi:histidyl-tRNA synthetase
VGDEELADDAVTVKTLATGEEWRGPRMEAVARIVEAGEDG